jgi:general secretion pathway protein A
LPVNPFHISPNPNSIHLTGSVKAVIAKAEYVITNSLGVTCILGDYGLGKSMLCRYLYQSFDSQTEEYVADLITTPVFSSEFAMVKHICQDFDLPARRSLSAQMEEMQGFLLENHKAGKKTVLFIDEANRLKSKDLEILRAFLNWETNEEKLLGIVLVGSLQLRDLILDEKNKPLYSRVVAPSTLDPMTPDEVKGLIETRQKFYETSIPFQNGAYQKLYTASNGVPRTCLKVAGLAVKLMELSGQSVVDGELIESAAEESMIEVPQEVAA